VNKNEVFLFPVTVPDEDSLRLLEDSCATLRHMGLNRSRGLGEIVCRVVSEKKEARSSAFTLEIFEDKIAASYKLRLISPIIPADRNGKPLACEDYIFGSAILGAFASRWLDKNKVSPQSACENAEFRRLFLEDAVKFTAAFPCDDQAVYYPAPSSLKTDKPVERLADESGGIIDENGEICRKLGGYVTFTGKGKAVVKRLELKKETAMHHSRPYNRAVAHAQGGNVGNGQMFTYEALSSKQEYAGSIIGTKADLEKLLELFKDSTDIYIGRSRTAQYGRCELSPLNRPAVSNSLTAKPGESFRVVVVTPLILADDMGTEAPKLSLLPELLGSKDLKIVRSFCSATTVAGYSAVWRLPRRQSRAVAEGGVIVLQNSSKKSVTVSANFIGERTNEGFGQIRIEPVPNCAYTFEPEKTETTIKPENESKNIDRVAAVEGAASIKTEEGYPPNSQLSRITGILSKSANFAELAEGLCEIRQETQKLYAFKLCTDITKREFENGEKEDMEAGGIEKLMMKKAKEMFKDLQGDELFRVYGLWLAARSRRLKLIRQAHAAKKKG
ncbi:MAG: hypothetical protein LBC41_14805, partial [Clostridiales bacterium]|nr:hypothetical protein [Clostridiales bacterium]